MDAHRNAVLTLMKRRELVERLEAGWTSEEAAAAHNVGNNTVRRG